MCVERLASRPETDQNVELVIALRMLPDRSWITTWLLSASIKMMGSDRSLGIGRNHRAVVATAAKLLTRRDDCRVESGRGACACALGRGSRFLILCGAFDPW